MSFSSRLGSFFNIDDEEERIEDDRSEPNNYKEPPRPDNDLKEQPNVMELHNNKRPLEKKIMLFEPRIFSDVRAIASRLLEGQAAVVNFQRMDDAQAHRVVDFLSGVVFAVDGEIKRIGEQIFLCTPQDFEVEGSLTDTMRDNDYNYK